MRAGLGTGIYTAAALARLTGISTARVKRWAERTGTGEGGVFIFADLAALLEWLGKTECLDYDAVDKTPLRWWPLGRSALVVIDPAYSFGKPVTANSRVSTFAIAEMLAAGDDASMVADWMRASLDEVRDAQRLETERTPKAKGPGKPRGPAPTGRAPIQRR